MGVIFQTHGDISNSIIRKKCSDTYWFDFDPPKLLGGNIWRFRLRGKIFRFIWIQGMNGTPEGVYGFHDNPRNLNPLVVLKLGQCFFLPCC